VLLWVTSNSPLPSRFHQDAAVCIAATKKWAYGHPRA
jgi:hypothetical protein